MRKFKIWVERSDIDRYLYEVEAETLEDAIELAETSDGTPEDEEHVYGEVLDSWEEDSR